LPLEHVVSEQVERKIISLLSTPDVSPYGNPIPGLEEFGLQVNPAFNEGVVSVAELRASKTADREFILRRIGEPLQVDPELLVQLNPSDWFTGARVLLQFEETYVFVSEVSNADGIELFADLAQHLFVEK
jgi:DtxR family Mn-dependent transcriptional regulator